MMTEQQKILSLLFSPDDANIELGLSIAKSLNHNDLMNALLLFMETKNASLSIENIKRLRNTYHFYHLSNQQLDIIPPEIGLLQQAHSFYLYNNNLTDLPKEIANLQNLTTLYLQNNKFESIPLCCLQAPQIKNLYFNANKISEIPAEIGNCRHLQALSLNNNQLRTLPQEILYLRELKMVFLDDNPWDFDTIPPAFFDPAESPQPICEALTRLRNDRERKN